MNKTLTEAQINRRWVEILIETLSLEKATTIGPNDASCFVNALRGILAAQQPEPSNAIGRSKRILALVDSYHENPTQHARTALRVALMDEFQSEPRAEDTDTMRNMSRHWNPIYNTNPVHRACAELPEGREIEILLKMAPGQSI